MMINKKYICAWCLVFFVLYSCNKREYVINESKIIEDEKWKVENLLPFCFAVSDTQQVYEIGLNVRYTAEYPKQNMYIFLHTVFPDGMRMHDTLSVDLFSQMGEAFGKGKRVKELQKVFSYVRFPMKGDYTMTIEQAMRMDTLQGVASVGLFIVKPIKTNK